ncbi:hypothetical protein DFH28DRAFT_899719 [Melampsora americana]|nr:hypothetical protein DFH28DRAFT_899719 [Melampsora americana]
MPYTRSSARRPSRRTPAPTKTTKGGVKPRPLRKCKASEPPSTRAAPCRTQKLSASTVNTRTADDSDSDSNTQVALPAADDVYMAFEPDSDDSASDNSDSDNCDSDHEIVNALAGKGRRNSKGNPNKCSTSDPTHSSLGHKPNQKRARVDGGDDPFMERLNRQFPATPSLPDTRGDFNEGGMNGQDEFESALNETLPTIENYKECVGDWPRWRISSVQNSQKKATSVPPKILAEAKAIKKIYKHHKRLLAMMGCVTPYTLDKSFSVSALQNFGLIKTWIHLCGGELGGTRFPDAYHLWMKFSVEARKHKMPRRGENGTILSQRNRKLGPIWKALSELHKRVFHPRIFYTLSGLPSPNSKDDTDDEAKGPIALSPDDRAELQAVYDATVCSTKVRQVYAKASAGIAEGRTLPDHNRLSLRCVERLHNQIENESNRMDFGYYFLVSSTHPATGGDSADPGWCREYTSNNELAEYVRSKSNFPTIFAAQTQGISVDKVIASTIGKNPRKVGRKDPGDKVKSELAALLKSELGFPRGPDPEALLRAKGWKVKIKQLPDSSLPPEVLKLGFSAMNSRRSLWLKDLEAGLFRFEKLPDDQDTNNLENERTEDNLDNERNGEEVGNTGNELEEEEWNGFGNNDIGDDE